MSNSASGFVSARVVPVPHNEAMGYVKKKLSDLMSRDPLLCDLPGEVTLDEVNAHLAALHGQAITVNIRRDDGEVLPIIVGQDATLRQFKTLIRRHITLKLERRGGPSHISWKYVWRNYWLYCDGRRLTDENATLRSYDVRNKDQVIFKKRLRHK